MGWVLFWVGVVALFWFLSRKEEVENRKNNDDQQFISLQFKYPKLTDEQIRDIIKVQKGRYGNATN